MDDLNERWERDTMYAGAEQAKLDRLIQTCAAAMSRRDWFRIGGEQVGCEAVHLRLMTLNCEEVGYALDYLSSSPCQYSSFAAYAIAVLYNAPEEAEHYWDRKIERDLYSGSHRRVVA